MPEQLSLFPTETPPETEAKEIFDIVRYSRTGVVAAECEDPMTDEEALESQVEHLRETATGARIKRELLFKNPDRTRDCFTFEQFQAEHRRWSEYNFGWNQDPMHPFLGIVEEVGEMSHALLKSKQSIRGSSEELEAKLKDGFGDVLVFMAAFANAKGWSMAEVLLDTWNQVQSRNWKRFPKNGRTE